MYISLQKLPQQKNQTHHCRQTKRSGWLTTALLVAIDCVIAAVILRRIMHAAIRKELTNRPRPLGMLLLYRSENHR